MADPDTFMASFPPAVERMGSLMKVTLLWYGAAAEQAEAGERTVRASFQDREEAP